MQQLKDSEIRRTILGEHERLRQRITELRAALDASGAATAPVPDVVTAGLHGFISFFLAHIAHEEEILRPALRFGDAWSAERVAHMDEEHREQRARLGALDVRDPAKDPAGYRAEIRATLTWILEDMGSEERELLTPELLRDDLVTVDPFGG